MYSSLTSEIPISNIGVLKVAPKYSGPLFFIQILIEVWRGVRTSRDINFPFGSLFSQIRCVVGKCIKYRFLSGYFQVQILTFRPFVLTGVDTVSSVVATKPRAWNLKTFITAFLHMLANVSLTGHLTCEAILNGLHLNDRHNIFKMKLTFEDDVVVWALPDYNLL